MKVRRTAEGRQRPEKSTIRIREATAKIGGASALGEIHKYETAQLEQRVPAWDYQLPPRPNASSGERPRSTRPGSISAFLSPRAGAAC